MADPPEEDAARVPLPVEDEADVDLTLVRMTLRMTPAQRLETLRAYAIAFAPFQVGPRGTGV